MTDWTDEDNELQPTKHTKKKVKKTTGICGKCFGALDEPAILAAYNKGERYVHECGRVLVHGTELPS